MAVVASAGGLVNVGRMGDQGPLRLPTAVEMYLGRRQTYEVLWRTQPHIRTVTDFLARNIAQLGLHVFRRKGDDERERLTDHPVAITLGEPAPWVTTYEFVRNLVMDLSVYDVAYVLKVREGGRVALVRLPPKITRPVGDNWLYPEAFEVTGPRGGVRYSADQVVYFHGYNPDDARLGTSPMETLRDILAESIASSEFRGQLWRSGLRTSGYIHRPTDAPEWSDGAKGRFTDELHDLYSGQGAKAGGVPVLEDGMEWHALGMTPEDAQYVEARKLTREEVAAAYHIPPSQVGVSGAAAYSSVVEDHKKLYQDTLGPTLQFLVQRLALQLLPEFPDTDGVYLEFNLAEKLRGSFEEQASSMSTLVGAPIMTRNEARARYNLPALPDGEGLVIPLNVLVGGQAAPTDVPGTEEGEPPGEPRAEQPKALGPAGAKAMVKAAKPSERWREKYAETLVAMFKRQQAAVASRLGAAKAGPTLASVWDRVRWDKELAADLLALNVGASKAAATAVLVDLGLDPETYDPAYTVAWLKEAAEGQARGINDVTEAGLRKALAEDDPAAAVVHTFEVAIGARAAVAALQTSSSAYGFGGREAAQLGGLTHKTWRTGGKNPRPTHARLNGKTVPIGDRFPNGLRWPGDSAGKEDETAGCTCEIDFHREGS